MSSESMKLAVLDELSTGAVEQKWLVERLSSKHGVDEGVVLKEIRDLMEKNEISYNLQWKLQRENRND